MSADPPMQTINADLVIVGAGLSGLSLAHRVLKRKKGLNVMVLEASDRTGGRVMTTADGIDLGPAWVWDRVNPRVRKLCGYLAAPLLKQPGTDDFEGQKRVVGGVARVVDGLTERIVQLGGEVCLSSPVSRVEATRQPPAFTEKVKVFTHMSADQLQRHGRDRHVLSPPSTGNPDGQNPPETGPSHPGSQPLGGGGSVPVAIMCTAVVLAVPPRILLKTVFFDPPLPMGKVNAMRATPAWMSKVSKVCVRYHSRTWDAREVFGAPASRGPAFQVYDASTADQAAIVSFCQGPELSDEQLQSLVAQQVGHMIRSAAQPQSVVCQRWEHAEWINEAARDQSMHHLQPDPALSKRYRNIVFSGSETGHTHPGYLEGALESAEDAFATVRTLLDF